MIVKQELQYLFGVHLMDAVSSKAHLWAYAKKLTPEQAVIAHIRAGFYQLKMMIVNSDPDLAIQS
jgi:hypothetical protein